MHSLAVIFPSGDVINGGCFYLSLGGLGILDGASSMCLSQVDEGYLSSHYLSWTILKISNHSYLTYELLEVIWSMENLNGNQITLGKECNRRLKRREGGSGELQELGRWGRELG